MKRLYDLYDAAGRRPARKPATGPESALEQIGREVAGWVDATNAAIDYLGNLLAAALATLRRPANINWGDVTRVMERAGADGVPIVVMITFLVGMVTAEFFLSSSGIGQLIMRSGQDFDIPSLYGSILVVTILGVMLISLGRALENRFAAWRGLQS